MMMICLIIVRTYTQHRLYVFFFISFLHAIILASALLLWPDAWAARRAHARKVSHVHNFNYIMRMRSRTISAMAHKGKVAVKSERTPPVATASTSERQRDAATTIHEVGEVYVYIPPELSAASVELKIVGSVRVVNKVFSVFNTVSVGSVYFDMHYIFNSALSSTMICVCKPELYIIASVITHIVTSS